MIGDNILVAMHGRVVFPSLDVRIQLCLLIFVWTEWEAIFASFYFVVASFLYVCSRLRTVILKSLFL